MVFLKIRGPHICPSSWRRRGAHIWRRLIESRCSTRDIIGSPPSLRGDETHRPGLVRDRKNYTEEKTKQFIASHIDCVPSPLTPRPADNVILHGWTVYRPPALRACGVSHLGARMWLFGMCSVQCQHDVDASHGQDFSSSNCASAHVYHVIM